MSASYRRRLERDLPGWVKAGWVKPEGAEAILANVRSSEPAQSNRLIEILSVLGAVLIGAGVISFVAANWQEMPRLVRLGLLAGVLWASYGAGAALFQRGLDMFAHGAVLVGSIVFGASVMLVAQMYHLHGNPPDAVFVWAGGALLAGVLMRSSPSVVLSLLLVCLWGGWETQIGRGVFWPFLPAWIAVTAALFWLGAGYGLKLAAVAISVWIVSLGYLMDRGHAHDFVAVMGIAIAGGGVALQGAVGKQFAELGRMLLAVGFAVVAAALFALQFVERPPMVVLIVLAVVMLAVCLAAIGWGIRSADRDLVRIGYVAFAAEICGLYAKTIGTLMNTSLFFLSAGVGVVALAVGAYWLNKAMNERIGAGQ
ncbi:MAG: DUF2157 domain-containing protein [Alphaproteobacteria bacterium]|nr:DUF2157 domain-containing protein [Alphaproteobacteria bacterium]